MNAIQQLTDVQARLDNALKLGLVKEGTRFLYTINGSGKCYEGTLLEVSPEGHVKLNESGTWDWPPEVRIEEMLAPRPQAELPKAGKPDSGPGPSPVLLPSAKPPTPNTKPKR